VNVFYIKVNKTNISGNLSSERLITLFYDLPIRQAEFATLAVRKSSKADRTHGVT